MCRQYNDYGSAVRDSDEGNLNSLDFAEFHQSPREDSMRKDMAVANGESAGVNGNRITTHLRNYPTDAMKIELMEIAEFERACMQLALQNLRPTIGSPATMKALQVFIDVTDLFGQIYVQKDIASRIQAKMQGVCY